jgi:hypothetical protein
MTSRIKPPEFLEDDNDENLNVDNKEHELITEVERNKKTQHYYNVNRLLSNGTPLPSRVDSNEYSHEIENSISQIEEHKKQM